MTLEVELVMAAEPGIMGYLSAGTRGDVVGGDGNTVTRLEVKFFVSNVVS